MHCCSGWLAAGHACEYQQAIDSAADRWYFHMLRSCAPLARSARGSCMAGMAVRGLLALCSTCETRRFGDEGRGSLHEAHGILSFVCGVARSHTHVFCQSREAMLVGAACCSALHQVGVCIVVVRECMWILLTRGTGHEIGISRQAACWRACSLKTCQFQRIVMTSPSG